MPQLRQPSAYPARWVLLPPTPLPSFLPSVPQQQGLGIVWGHLGSRWGGVSLGRGFPELGTAPLLLHLSCHSGSTINHLVLASRSLTSVTAQAKLPRPRQPMTAPSPLP